MERFEASDYHDIVQVTDPRLSPDGERVAFVRKEPTDDDEYETTVYVVSAAGDGPPRQFTAEEGSDGEPRWSPSGDRLAFTSARGDADTPQLWVLPTDGGEARQVTDVVGGVGSIAWSPHGEHVAFVQRATAEERDKELDLDASEAPEYEREAPDPRVIDRTVYRAGTQYFDGLRSHLYTVTVGHAGEESEGDVTRHTDGEFDFSAPEFGDSDTLYYAVNRDEDPDDSIVYDIDALDLSSGEAETLVRTTGWVATIAATEDGLVAYPRTPEEKAAMRQTELEVIDRETGETVTPTGALDRTVAPAGFQFDGDLLYFLTPDEGALVARRAAIEDDADCDVLVSEGELSGLSVQDGRVAFTRSEWDHRGDVFSLVDGDTTRLSEVNADLLAERDVQEPEEFWFTSDENDVQGWVLTPPDYDPDEEYPLAVEIHGGPHVMWSTSGTMFHEFQLLAARGYVVFWCNPRGSTGYGEDHAMGIDRDWGDVTMQDVFAGADVVCEEYGVDEDAQFVTGGSFGGYMTAWIVGHSDRFAGAVAQRGVYDLSSFYGSTDAFQLIEMDFSTTPWEDPEFLWEHSPVAHVEDVTTPTLVMHADDDYRVPVNNGEMLYLFLRKQGVDTRLVRYPREGHELSRSGEPSHVVDRLERTVRWFDGYSDHHDVERALDRGDDGLSSAEESDAEDDGE
ncbi:S9 family peptidase [Halomarina oriensis]|uniref:Prolyl oligopeptidase family serine peptidase n=1 Tax=Halomarina oriensis TaxID=671145 RepID=A0A6B0GKL9_9EURY|nr:S9 family peptidase [Halomarina oriensis]MWG34347.1 prolyl oligopeptidase family serine peptidase [Halomarina oriensis]